MEDSARDAVFDDYKVHYGIPLHHLCHNYRPYMFSF